MPEMTKDVQINRDFQYFSRLLGERNQFWAIQFSHQLLLRQEQNAVSDSERIHTLTTFINLWDQYIIKLGEDFSQNWPFIYAAFGELFSLLTKLGDENRIFENGIKLARILFKIKATTNEKIANFLESLLYSLQTSEIDKGLELLILIIFLNDTYEESELFNKYFKEYERILLSISPEQRTLLANTFFHHVFSQFFLSLASDKDEYKSFLTFFFRSISSHISSPLQNVFTEVFTQIMTAEDLLTHEPLFLSLIESLQILGEFTWAFILVKNYCDQLIHHQKLSKAIQFLQTFISRVYKFGAYSSCFQGYQYLVKIEGKPTQRWGEAANSFRYIGDHTYFIATIENLRKTLQIPANLEQMEGFSFAMNEHYRMKRGILPTTENEFWWAAFHRSIFEEGFEEIANFALPHIVSKDITRIKTLFWPLLRKTQSVIIEEKMEKKDRLHPLESQVNPNVILILRILQHEPVSLQANIVQGSQVLYKIIRSEEYWDDPFLIQLFQSIPLSQANKPSAEKLSLRIYGKLAYLFLPMEIRVFLREIRNNFPGFPNMYVLFDNPSIPFEIIFDQSRPFGIQYALGYQTKLASVFSFVPRTIKQEEEEDFNKKFSILSVGNLNEFYPQIWNEATKQATPMFSSPEGSQQTQYLTEKLNNLQFHIDKFTVLPPNRYSRQSIEQELGLGQYHIIHIASNLFYNAQSPLDSYFLPSDSLPLSIRDILELLAFARHRDDIQPNQSRKFIKPLLIFDGQIILQSKTSNVVPITEKPEILSRSFVPISAISQAVQSSDILGLLSRITLEYTLYAREFLGIFLNHLLLMETIGNALFNANQHLHSTIYSILQQDYDVLYLFYGDLSQKLD